MAHGYRSLQLEVEVGIDVTTAVRLLCMRGISVHGIFNPGFWWGGVLVLKRTLEDAAKTRNPVTLEKCSQDMESKPASSPQPQETEVSSVPVVASDSSQTTARTEGKYVLPWNRPSVASSTPLELHRRCRETIERCAAKLRERQRKMERLQIVLPSPKTQRTTRQRPNSQHLTPPSRSTPPRPTKRNKLGVTSIFDRKRHSTLSTPPSWSPSSVSALSSRHSLHTTPPSRFTSPSLNQKSPITTRTQLQSPNENNSPQLNQQEEKHETSDSHQPNAAIDSWALRQKAFMDAIEAEALSDSNSA